MLAFFSRMPSAYPPSASGRDAANRTVLRGGGVVSLGRGGASRLGTFAAEVRGVADARPSVLAIHADPTVSSSTSKLHFNLTLVAGSTRMLRVLRVLVDLGLRAGTSDGPFSTASRPTFASKYFLRSNRIYKICAL